MDNSLKHLSDGGTIVCHDCNPPTKESATPQPKVKQWLGTTYQAFIEFRMNRDDLFMCVVDADCGCGIIKKGAQDLLPKQNITYEFLEKNRKSALNLISFDEFMESGL